jgi:heat shock protein HslJ
MRIGARLLPKAMAVLAVTVLPTACGDQVGTAAESLDIAGSWHLVEGRDAEGDLDLGHRQVTLAVEDGAASGTSACNMYGANVHVEGETVRFAEIGGTEMACEPDVMELERRFLAVLGAVEAGERDGDVLRLSDADATLTFARDAPLDDAALVGTTWALESLVDQEAASSVVPGGELRFLEGGVLTGSSGCRAVRGHYEVHGQRVSVSELDAGDPHAGACMPDAEAQHGHVVDVLREGFAVHVEGDRLTLTSPQGLGLALRAR